MESVLLGGCAPVGELANASSLVGVNVEMVGVPGVNSSDGHGAEGETVGNWGIEGRPGEGVDVDVGLDTNASLEGLEEELILWFEFLVGSGLGSIHGAAGFTVAFFVGDLVGDGVEAVGRGSIHGMDGVGIGVLPGISTGDGGSGKSEGSSVRSRDGSSRHPVFVGAGDGLRRTAGGALMARSSLSCFDCFGRFLQPAVPKSSEEDVQ